VRQGKAPRADLSLGRFAVKSEDFISPRDTPTVRKKVRIKAWFPRKDIMCWWWQELSVYKELLGLLSAKGVSLSAVLPDESGPAVALPGVCRLTRVQGYGGGPQQKPLLLIGRWRGTSRTACSTYASKTRTTP
jgi:hypothetical protein